jgi:hypothetical protein
MSSAKSFQLIHRRPEGPVGVLALAGHVPARSFPSVE